MKMSHANMTTVLNFVFKLIDKIRLRLLYRNYLWSVLLEDVILFFLVLSHVVDTVACVQTLLVTP